MDGQSFDRLARRIAASSSRRSFLKGVLGTALATGLGSLRPDQSDAAGCKATGLVCREHGNCCSGICGDKDRTGRRKCVCPPGQDDLKGKCVDPKTAYLADVNNCGAQGVKCPRTKCQLAICGSGVCGLAPDSKAVGKSCDDGNPGTVKDICQPDGSCKGTPTDCSGLTDQCNLGVFDTARGKCVKQPKSNGTICDDGDACTLTDTCQAGVCVGTNPVVCTASDQCHNPGTCDPQTGQCSNPAAANGSPCDDGDACTQTDTCQAGVCVGGNPVVCAALDDCHVTGTCDPATGTCANPDAADGTPCNDDNACTSGDTCQHGVCTGGAATICDSKSPCIVDSCHPDTGCVQTFKDAGTPCADDNRCDGDEVCDGAGVCADGTAITCATPVDAQCQETGVCDAATGICSYANKENGSPCTLTDKCFQTASCQSGVCTGANPVVCTASDPCHVAGFCDPATGGCSNPNAPDDTPCTGTNLCTTGTTCTAGVCGGGSAVNCDDNNPCTIDSCNPQTGCVHTPKVCDDNNPCTIDTCDVATGQCVFTPRNCNDNNACTIDSCDVATGACINRPKDCDDSNPCTIDTCDPQTGCVHTPKTCQPLDQCHVAGACDPQTGQCSNPAAPNGTICTDGNSNCRNGVCCSTGGMCPVVDLRDGVVWGATPTCCEAGSSCSTTIVGVTTVGLCCPAGETGRFRYVNSAFTAECVAESEADYCPVLAYANGTPVVTDMPCDPGTVCATMNLNGTTQGRCCRPEENLELGLQDGVLVFTCSDTCPADLCPVASFDDGTPTLTDTCCPLDTACSTTSFNGVTVGRCCPASLNAEISVDNGVPTVTCAACSADLCPVITEVGGVRFPLDTCCASGTTCSTASGGGRTAGLCCPAGQSVYFAFPGDVNSLFCAAEEPPSNCPVLSYVDGSPILTDTVCGPDTVCATVQGSGITVGRCCPTGQIVELSVDGGSVALTCVSSSPDDHCPVFSIVNGSPVVTVTACEPGTACTSTESNGVTMSRCCPTGQVTQITFQNNVPTLICTDPCLTELCPAISIENGTPTVTNVCCPSGTSCKPTVGNGLPYGICCADDPCMTIDGPVCCSNGASCQSLAANGITLNHCCPPEQNVQFTYHGGVPSITCVDVCPADLCPVYSAEGGVTSITDTCCPSGTACSTTSPYGLQTVGRCCPSGQSAQVTLDDGIPILTCVDVCPTDLCPVYSVEGGVPSVTDTCCSSGTACSTTSPNGFTVGRCCPPGQTAQVTHDGDVPTLTCVDVCPTDLCPVYSAEGGIPSITDTCCRGETICSTTSPNGFTVGRCCPPGQSAQVTYDGDVPTLTCSGATAPNDHCPVLSYVNGSPVVTDTACGSETVCLTTRVNGTTVGQCCPPDQTLQVSLDRGVPILTCVGGGSCSTDLCPVGNLFAGITQTCCPNGTSCKTASIYGIEMSTCCAGDVCPRINPFAGGPDMFVLDCCDSGQSCFDGGGIPSSGVCCSAGGKVCIPDGGSPADQVCCGAGHECVSPSFGFGGIPGGSDLGQTLNVCCPLGSSAEFSGGRSICVVPCAQPCNPFGPGGGCCNPPGPDCTTVCDHPIWGLACCDALLPPPALSCDNPCPMGHLTTCCDPGVCGDIVSVPFAGSIGTCSSS